MINELAKEIHQNAIQKGFFEKPKNLGEMLCLIHSEVSEALEAIRIRKNTSSQELDNSSYLLDTNTTPNFISHFEHHIKNSFEDELADVIIRTLDLCAFLKIDIEKHIELKMKYNSFREHKHGKQF